jgi:YbgC/YbaW family acyl-CoA thioester hydrolase
MRGVPSEKGYEIEHTNVAKVCMFCQAGAVMSETLTIATREEVMFFDTDCGGVVHNLAYLRMIETCRTRLAALMGMDLPTMAKTQLYPVVVRTEADYRFPAKLGDWLRIEGTLAEIEGARFWCHFVMIRESDGQELVRARQALALVQMPEGKPRRLPAEWRQKWNAGARG